MHTAFEPFAPPVAPPRRRRGVGAIGVALLVAGVALGATLITQGSSAEADTVAGYARAPIGCSTTLRFDRSGMFTFFIETKGRVGSLGGNCARDNRSFEHSGSAPVVQLELTDAAGKPVALTNYDGMSYDTGSYVGVATAQAMVVAGATYRLAATASTDDIGVAVGGSPVARRNELITWGSISLFVGGLVGGALIAYGRRRNKPSSQWAAPTPSTNSPWAPPSW